MSFTFYPTIPAANNNPSQDQPKMLTNNASTNSIIGVDHISFNTSAGGTHKQVTFSTPVTPSTPTGASSVVFTGNGSATASGISQTFFQNSQATFLLNCAKAFAVFQTTSGNADVSPTNSYNISTTITKPGPGQATYVISLNANVVAGNNVIVLTNLSTNSTTPAYTFSSGTLTLTTGAGPGVFVSFVVLQA